MGEEDLELDTYIIGSPDQHTRYSSHDRSIVPDYIPFLQPKPTTYHSEEIKPAKDKVIQIGFCFLFKSEIIVLSRALQPTPEEPEAHEDTALIGDA